MARSSVTAPGGAIYNSGTLTVTNSTFSANQTSILLGAGSAIYNNSGTLTLTNSTFSANQAAPSGGAIAIGGGTATAKGTILAASSGGNCNTTLTDGGYNIADDSTCGFSKTGSG